MAIGVTFELFGRSGSFVKAAGRARKAMTGLKSSVTSFASSKAVQFLGAGAIIGTFTSLGREALALSAQLEATSQKLGLTAEFLQEMGYAAAQNEISQETLNMGMQRFTRRMAEAREGGGELLGVLQKYNIQLRDSEGNARNTEAVFGDLAEVIKNTKDPAERLRVAFKAFDSEGVGLVNVLKDGKAGLDAWGAAARENGQVLEDETVASLARASNAIENFRKKAVVAVGNILVNFQSEEGLKSLGIKFTKVATNFAVLLADGIFEVSLFVPKYLGKKLIDVAASFLTALLGPLSQFDFAQSIIGKITDSATFLKDVISETRPKALLKGFNDAADLLIAEYEHAARIQTKAANDAAETTTKATEESGKHTLASFDALRRKINAAGEKLKKDAEDAAESLADGGKEAATHLKEAAVALRKGFGGLTTSAMLEDASDDALREMIRKAEREIAVAQRNPNLGTRGKVAMETATIAAAQRELEFRQNLRRDAGFGVDFARRNFQGDPLAFDKVFAQYVSKEYKDSAAILEETKTTNRLLRGKFKPE